MRTLCGGRAVSSSYLGGLGSRLVESAHAPPRALLTWEAAPRKGRVPGPLSPRRPQARMCPPASEASDPHTPEVLLSPERGCPRFLGN